MGGRSQVMGIYLLNPFFGILYTLELALNCWTYYPKCVDEYPLVVNKFTLRAD